MINIVQFSGVFISMTTPFTLDGEKVDINKLEKNLDIFSQTDLKGYSVLGSTGEKLYLNKTERKKVLSTVLKKRNFNQLVMVDCSHESIEATVNSTKWAAEIGAEIAKILPPHYYNKLMTDRVILHFFEKVANHSPIPIVLYNAPNFTGGVTISMDILSILNKHPNIVGIKDSSLSSTNNFLSFMDKKFPVMAGTISTFLSTLAMGGVGGILSMANYHPKVVCSLYKLFNQGKMDEARDLQHALIRLNSKISFRYGVAGTKYSMDVVGLYGGNPRLPLLPLSDNEKNSVRDALNKFNKEYPEYKGGLLIKKNE